jgi:hypothetical protein
VKHLALGHFGRQQNEGSVQINNQRLRFFLKGRVPWPAFRANAYRKGEDHSLASPPA